MKDGAHGMNKENKYGVRIRSQCEWKKKTIRFFWKKNTEETSKYFVERNLEFKTKETTKTLFECLEGNREQEVLEHGLRKRNSSRHKRRYQREEQVSNTGKIKDTRLVVDRKLDSTQKKGKKPSMDK